MMLSISLLAILVILKVGTCLTVICISGFALARRSLQISSSSKPSTLFLLLLFSCFLIRSKDSHYIPMTAAHLRPPISKLLPTRTLHLFPTIPLVNRDPHAHSLTTPNAPISPFASVSLTCHLVCDLYGDGRR
jgi:hypothetical protein